MKPQFPAAASGTTDDERPSPAAPTYAPTTHDARGTTFYALRFTFHVSRFTSPWLFTLALLVLLGLAWGAAPIDVHADHPAGSRLYVNDDAPGPTHDGATWSTAFTRLQVALTHAVSGTEIWVATGVYTPGTTVSDTFTLKSGVAIYGGFAATETLREQRDWRANVTVLSGDLEGNDTTNADGVVTDTDNISGANSYHVLVGSGTDATALLDGFTVTAGHANGSYLHHDRGAGMRNVGGSPTVANVTFSGNLAAWAGGGMFNEQGSNSILTNVTFSGNSANLAGGGMSNLGSRTTLTNITFIGNSAEFGGGMIDDGWSNSILTNVTFSGNSARTGGGMYASGSGLALIDVTFSGNRAEEGGGLANVRSEMTLTNVTFSGNSADDGGGMFNNWLSEPALANVIFSGNSASHDGGAMYNIFYSRPTLANVTFSGNSASHDGGAMFSVDNSSATVRNSILWDNSGNVIVNDTPSDTVEYSLVQGGYISGTNILDVDPRFVDADGADDQLGTPDDDLRLLATSPAIDAGNNNFVLSDTLDLDGVVVTVEPLPRDFAGRPRFSDKLSAADTGSGTAPIVDMGAYEAGPIFVDDDAAGAGSGTSWEDAFTDLQDGLRTAGSGDEIWVASGVYTPGLSRTDSFSLTSGVAIFGGFAATETLREQRDWRANVTVLSGDINGDDTTDANGVVTNTDNISGTNSYHVVMGSDAGPNAILDGVTVTAGRANGDAFPHYGGGGMYNDTDSSPTLANVTFSGNGAKQFGGGMLNDANSRASLTNVTFSSNSAQMGGGMVNLENSSAQLANVTFKGNSAVTSGGAMLNASSSLTLTNLTFSGNQAYVGGGMYNESSRPVLANVTFSGNSAHDGGGMYNEGSHAALANVTFSGNSASNQGGGMYNSGSDPTLVNVTFSGNSASEGGGMFNRGELAIQIPGGPTLANVTFSRNSAIRGGGMFNNRKSPTLANVTFGGNLASDDGGGIYNEASRPELSNVTFSANSASDDGGGMYNSGSDPALTNVTFSANSASSGGGIFNAFASYPTIRNSILWGDSNGEVVNANDSSPTVEYSLVQGGYVRGTNILKAGPRFADANGADDQPGTPDDDLRLLATSPAIDAGNSTFVLSDTTDLDGDSDSAELLPIDLDGNARFVDHPIRPSANVALPPVDMGAYEAFSLAFADDDDTNVRYDGWVRLADASALGGAHTVGQGRGERMSYWASRASTAMTLFAYRGPNQGQARILIDGVDKGIVDFYSPTVAYQQAYTFRSLPERRHTIEVVVLDRRNPASSGRQVRIDAFRAPGAPIHQENNVLVRYNGWSASNLASAFGGSYRLSKTNGDAVFFTVEGDRFTWITERGPNRGWAQITVDGTPVRNVNLYHSAVDRKYPVQIAGLPAGRHRVKISALGVPGADPGDRYVVFDGFNVP